MTIPGLPPTLPAAWQNAATKALDAVEQTALKAAEVSDEMSAICAEDPRPWTRTPVDLAELRHLADRAGVRGYGYAAAPGVLSGATGVMATGTALMVATAPGSAILASAKDGTLGAQLKDPVRAARSFFVDAPRRQLAEGPLATALTGLPSSVAFVTGAATSAVFGPAVASALVSAELVSGGIKLAQGALKAPRER